ncbi:hypothetical protein KR52_09610 [Synechococcus sp. KORDI-52]|uniref:hypothetical protein n=1 Tax=Synechococcus sp. KORDI-52 TaxID=585425 RepID=UPI0004E03F33|nr:hypothetical protein [Synechococcus sp. KORDI-52]AII49395.1 hypothetical protein KR52_09610 [Synechococcus sp. KORDI-52]
MANAYTFTTHLDGFVNVLRDANKYDNRCFSYKIDEDTHDQIHGDRWELIRFAKEQTNAKKPYEIPLPWDDDLCIRYIYSAALPSWIPVFVDAEGRELNQAQLELIKRGSKVELYVEQTPFLMDTKVARAFTQGWAQC